MKDTIQKKRILVICTHNAARSQIAEGLMNSVYGDRIEAYSAGTEPTQVNPYAVMVMAELDIDISQNESKSVNAFVDQKFDYVVTVCDGAREACPFFPGAKEHLHQSFADPSTFEGTEEEKLAQAREVRDKIKEWIENTF